MPILEYINIKTIGLALFNHLDSHNIFQLSYTLPSHITLANLLIFAFAISLVIASQVSICTSIGSSITFNQRNHMNMDLIC